MNKRANEGKLKFCSRAIVRLSHVNTQPLLTALSDSPPPCTSVLPSLPPHFTPSKSILQLYNNLLFTLVPLVVL
jgi:hypothetical protein